MENREPIWWLPLLSRMLRWGATMSLLWLFPVLLIVCVVACVFPVTIKTLPFSFAILFLGFVTGVACAFCAPPTECENSFESLIFRAAGLDTFFYLMSLGGCLNLAITNSDVVAFVGRFVPVLPVQIASVSVLFVFSLWLSLTRALRVLRKSN